MKLFVFIGSLRKESYNRYLANYLKSQMPDDFEWEEADIGGLPFYNDDLQSSGPPEAVKGFQQKVKEADALVILSPEYNWSLPAVLKNALDWASRPSQSMPLAGKPVFLGGASGGPVGTARMQLALRQVFGLTKNVVANSPDIMLSFAPSRFDAEGRLVDEESKKLVDASLRHFVAYLRDARKKG